MTPRPAFHICAVIARLNGSKGDFRFRALPTVMAHREGRLAKTMMKVVNYLLET